MAAWAPTLEDVARHIPRRTRSTRTPGQDTTLGTFGPDTTPTGESAQASVDAAVTGIEATLGTIPAVATLQALAREAAEWRAAADIELAYPNRDADVAVAAQLAARADQAMARLGTALAEAGAGEVTGVPVWSFPPPPAYGDDFL